MGVAATAAIAMPIAAFAATATTQGTTFVQMLAQKLGLDQSTVQTAVDSVKTDMQTTQAAQYKTEVATAVTDGKLTQRQADLLLAIQDVQSTLTPAERPTQTDPSTLTQEQRQAQMTAERTAMEQKLVDALNAKGLNTTSDEVTAARTAAQTAGLRGGFGMGGRGGMRGGNFGGPMMQ